MSGRLTIRFSPDMPAATVEVVSPDMQVVDRVMLSPGRSRGVDVPSERTFLRVHLPSGQVVTLQDPGNLDREISMATIRGGASNRRRAAAIRLETPEIEPEATFDSIRRYARERPLAPRTPEGQAETLPLSSHATASVTAPGGFPISGVSSSGGSEAHWEIGGAPGQPPLQFQIQHTGSKMRLEMRVPGNAREIWARSDTVREQPGITISVRISTSQPAADTILGYLQRGDLYSAEAMAEWCDEAEAMLMSKMADPYAAAVGGYLLLRLRRFDQLRDWARNLANYFPFLSDGSIIWATQLMYQHPSRESEIREYLLKAATIGPPLYAEGMSLLTDGLRLMGPPGRPALEHLLHNRDVLVQTSPLTAFLRASEGFTAVSGASAVLFDIAFSPGS